jgi:hypothetical protein
MTQAAQAPRLVPVAGRALDGTLVELPVLEPLLAATA